MLNLKWIKPFVSAITLSAFFFSCSWFSLLAIISIYLTNVLNLSAMLTATIMMVTSIASKLTRLMISALFDRLAPHYVIALSASIISVSCLVLAITTNTSFVVLAILGFGIAYGSTSMVLRTLTGVIRDNKQRAEKFVQLSVITNLASMVAPLACVSLYEGVSVRAPFILNALIMLFLASISLFKASWPKLPPQQPWLDALKQQIKSKNIFILFILTILCWTIYSQLFSALPLYVEQQLGSTKDVGYLLSFNALLSVILASPVHKITLRFCLSTHHIIIISLLLHALGSLSIHFSSSNHAIYFSLLIWTMGELLLIPTLQSILAGSVDGELLVSVTAINAIAMGLGEGFGSFLGVILTRETHISFLVFSGISIITLLYAWHYRRYLASW
ncbi:hypothetical protein BN439_2922 [Erwinia amylovora Ea644]|nr:hypothetical protein BN439_2922 [Erwinia amylovora Ea644]